MGEDGARGKDWSLGTGASPVSYRHNFLVSFVNETNIRDLNDTECTERKLR